MTVTLNLTRPEAEERLLAAARAGKHVEWRRYAAMGIDVQGLQAQLGLNQRAS
jgi:hypothetical protein